MQVLIAVFILSGLVALTKKIVDFARYAKAGHKNGVVTQAIVWVTGILVTFLTTSQSAIRALIDSGSVHISSWDGLEKVILGVLGASIASVMNDYFAARDNTDTQVRPVLVPPSNTCNHVDHAV